MNGTIDRLRDLGSQLSAIVSEVFGRAEVRGLSDERLMDVMDAAGMLLRGAQALLAESAGEVAKRSESPVRAERLTTRLGCATPGELLERVTRMSGRAAAEYVKAGRATAVSQSAVSGEVLPAEYPAMRGALADGAVGVDGVLAVTSVLDTTTTGREHRDAAEAALAAASRGHAAGDAPTLDGVAGGVPGADELRLQARVWAAYL